MQPERRSQPNTDDQYLLIQWKDRPDSWEPWWVHLFYDYAYIPFQRFSFKYFHIPRVKQASVTADEKGRVTTTFSWFENGGVYDTPEQADLACIDEFDGYKPITHNRCAPKESAEYGTPIFPRSKNPRRWAKRSMSLVIKDRKQDEQKDQTLAQALQQLNQVLR
jgi:hypothetical protein